MTGFTTFYPSYTLRRTARYGYQARRGIHPVATFLVYLKSYWNSNVIKPCNQTLLSTTYTILCAVGVTLSVQFGQKSSNNSTPVSVSNTSLADLRPIPTSRCHQKPALIYETSGLKSLRPFLIRYLILRFGSNVSLSVLHIPLVERYCLPDNRAKNTKLP